MLLAIAPATRGGAGLANSATSLAEPFKASLWVLALSLSFDEDDFVGLEDIIAIARWGQRCCDGFEGGVGGRLFTLVVG